MSEKAPGHFRGDHSTCTIQLMVEGMVLKKIDPVSAKVGFDDREGLFDWVIIR
jgi:hypothetical protein